MAKIIVKDGKYYFKIRNLGGPKGDTGATGATGPQGPQGPYVDVVAGTTTTLPAGSNATVSVQNAGNTSVLNFGIPQGIKGDKGDTGAKGSTGPQGVRGPRGETGAAGQNATVTIGNTTTGAPGSSAQVTNSGTENNAVLNFTIPRGNTGATGPANTLSIGTVAKGDDASATITGTAPNQTLNLVLPKGDKGDKGAVDIQVVDELPPTGDPDTMYLVSGGSSDQSANGVKFTASNYTDETYPITGYTFGSNSAQSEQPSITTPVPVPIVTRNSTTNIRSKNIANPQTFKDWENTVYNLCVQYEWGTETTRPTYGAFYGRDHVVGFDAGTLYSVKDQMTDPTYDEARVIYSGIFEQNTVYTFSADIYSAGNNGATNLRIQYLDGAFSNITPTGKQGEWAHISFTSIAGKTVQSIAFTYQSGRAYVDLDTLQIEEGAQPTMYQAYYAPQTGQINLTKNLVDPDLMWHGYIQIGGVPINSSGPQGTGDMCTPYIKVKPNTQYTFEIYETTGTAANWIGYCEYTDRNPDTIIGQRYVNQNGDPYYTFTTTATAEYIRLSARNLSTATKYQLSEGERTTYEPYIGLAGLANLPTSDYLHKVGSKWYWHKSMQGIQLPTSSSNWGMSGVLAGVFLYTRNDILAPSGNSVKNSTLLSDMFYSGFSYNDLIGSSGTIAAPNSAAAITFDNKVAFKNTNLTTTAQMANWCARNGAIAYYPLATPMDIEITSQSLIADLEALDLNINPGDNVVYSTSSTGDASANIGIVYDTSDPQDKYVEYVWTDGAYNVVGDNCAPIPENIIEEIAQ